MRFLSSSLALFLSIFLVNATLTHNSNALSARHARLSQARSASSSLEARQASGKRCPNRKGPKSANSTDASTANNAGKKSTNSNPGTPAPAPPAPARLMQIQSDQCGPSRATPDVQKLSGPNGHIDWMNCGLEGAGWNPPAVNIKDVITQPLNTALEKWDSPFKACANFIWIFEKYGNQFSIPPIMLASFAMQESGCNPDTVGGGGEQGLMQITHEKCAGAPNGNCRDPEFNIATAAKFFAQTLKDCGGNVFLAVGRYNGWERGLTTAKAFAARWTPCCRCQNNADYIHQYFNGWIQNVNAYNNNLRLGKFFNLDVCNQ